jgi:hypothetical protein
MRRKLIGGEDEERKKEGVVKMRRRGCEKWHGKK